MALLPQAAWDVTQLAKKYPWLRVDQEAIEEFRSPFHWVSEPSSRSAEGEDNNDEVESKQQKKKRRVKHAREAKKLTTKTKAAVRTQEKLFLQSLDSNILNSPETNGFDEDEVLVPQLRLPSPDQNILLSSLAIPTIPTIDSTNRVESTASVLELLQQDHDSMIKLRAQKKKQLRKRKPHSNVLTLRFPVISPKQTRHSSKDNWKQTTSRTLMKKYSKQLAHLAEEEERIEQNVMARIEMEKSRLPLRFLFERNLLRRSDAQQDGLRIVTAIFAKLQHRLMYAGFLHWKEFLENVRHQERKQEGIRVAKRRAVALLERVSSDAYVGTLAGGFQRWKNSIQMIVDHEHNSAAKVIQAAFRARRSRLHLEALRQAAQALDYRRNQAIEALLRFERYGVGMLWSTLRIGGNFAKQNRAARNLQLFLRRVAVRRRVAHRILRRDGAIRIQAHWRAHKAREEVERRRIERARQLALEVRAATQMQRRVRGLLARSEAFNRRQWLAKAIPKARQIQRWVRHCWAMVQLHSRFNNRKRIINAAKARAAAEELARLRWRSALAVQCTLRGMFARKVYARKLLAQHKDRAARFLQRFWRRRKGLYALGIRFAERRERLAQQRLLSAITIQCVYRSFHARCERFKRALVKEIRRRAATVIQRRIRGVLDRIRYRQARRAVLIIQCSIRCALARRRIARRLSAIIKLQRWIRGVFAGRLARQVLAELKAEEKRRQSSAALIQKFIRQYEAQITAKLYREALSLVKLEQRRYFGDDGGTGWSTHKASSELLTYVTQRFLEDSSSFTTKETRWLKIQVQAARDRILHEDRAAVFLQRRFRGYATRMGYWVHRLQLDELRRLKEAKAIVIQSFARRWLAIRRVRRLREQKKLAELKDAYIRERRRKQEEIEWKERYDREQMKLCVQRAQEAANQLREARREADLARVKAEAAAYRAQELAAEREIESMMKTPVVKKEEGGEEDASEDTWEQYTDDFGNVYYYNERTGASSWEPPPPPVEKEHKKANEEVDRTKDEEETYKTEVLETVDRKPKEVDPLEAILRDGKCVKCQQVQSTKRCVDCEDSLRAYYCTKCFKKEHASEDTNSSKRYHDFEVLPEATVIPARCESAFNCNENDEGEGNNQEPTEKGLAAYYCYECRKTEDDKPGCFYCEACFARGHETAKQLRHIEKALRFRRGALLCCDCGNALAVRQCDGCGGEKFCEECYSSSHSNSKRRSGSHSWKALEIMRDLLQHETDAYCVECDMRASSKLCNLCGDGFCDGCFVKTHSKGAKSRHTFLPWAVAAQHGDWIEIKDDKATIYFNVETKESTNDKPAVLLSGEERHRLQLVEREQQQRSRQVELESEVVRLKEQLRELQAKERPLTKPPTLSTESNQKPVEGIKQPEKPEKRGVMTKLFGRKSKAQIPTPEERKKIADRSAAEKKQVGSKAFQQAMVQELAALAVPSQTSTKPK